MGTCWLISLLIGLTACDGQASSTSGNATVQIAQVDGTGSVVHTDSAGPVFLASGSGSTLKPGDRIAADSAVTLTLKLNDNSALTLGPGSRLSLVQIREIDQRPVFRLLAGTLIATISDSGPIVQAYREETIKFSTVTTILAVMPKTNSVFRLWHETDALKVDIESGEADVEGNNQQATLPAGWQAILEPEKPLQIIEFLTPTPLPLNADTTPTPIRIITLTPLPTATPTATPTDTPTPTPTFTPLPTRPRPTLTITSSPEPSLMPGTPLPTATDKPDKPPKATPVPPTTKPPTAEPTNQPTPEPTFRPTALPTPEPSAIPGLR